MFLYALMYVCVGNDTIRTVIDIAILNNTL